jgi:glycosyltransferase involved in cell wall biosynthesis
MNRVGLSAIVIAKNEERVIERCLRSLSWCDESILVDSGSTDGTVDIARASGARVIVNTDWQGPATQRNRGIDSAQGPWCLLLDADEWVEPPLRDEVTRVLAAAPGQAAFQLPRSSSYCGRYMRHGGWWPDRITRLIRKGAARYEGGIVHEHCEVQGAIGRLTQPLMHESFRDLEQVLGKVNAYSTWGAQDLAAAGRRPSLARAVFSGAYSFLRTYVLRAGFLDGRHGFMLAVSNAEGTYYKYLKAMLAAERDRARSDPPRAGRDVPAAGDRGQ